MGIEEIRIRDFKSFVCVIFGYFYYQCYKQLVSDKFGFLAPFLDVDLWI